MEGTLEWYLAASIVVAALGTITAIADLEKFERLIQGTRIMIRCRPFLACCALTLLFAALAYCPGGKKICGDWWLVCYYLASWSLLGAMTFAAIGRGRSF